MGNLYEYFAELVGYVANSSQNSNIIYCACICAIVLFCQGMKLIFRGFDRLFGYNTIR